MSDSAKQDKPRQVVTALGLFWVTIVFGLIKLGRALAMPAGAGGHSFMIFMFVAIYALMVLITLYIGMGAAWARGGMLVLSLIGILPAVPLVFSHFTLMPVLGVLTCGQALAQVVGLYLVYREPAASWFGRPLSR